MKYLVTPQQMRFLEDSEAKNGISLWEMMKRAGSALAEFIVNSESCRGSVVIFCGSGNNGGDGLVCANRLAETGIAVTAVMMCGDPSTELAVRAYCELSSSSAEVLNLNDNIDKIFARISEAAVIVDSVFGTGFHGELPPHVKACFSYAMRSPAVKIAADCPSGADCVTGSVCENVIKCNYTITFAEQKVGMVLLPMKAFCGDIITADIGIDKKHLKSLQAPIILEDMADTKKLIPPRPSNAHKGNFGRLLNIAGSRRMPGAAALSTLAALRSGVGLCTLASAKTVCESLSSSVFETMYLPMKENPAGGISVTNKKELLTAALGSDAVAIGCGCGKSDDILEITKELLTQYDKTIIIDADGINSIASDINILTNTRADVIVTPHPAELARLLGVSVGDVLADRLGMAQKLAKSCGVTVVSKGTPTVIAAKSGFCHVCAVGNAGLSRGGSGDVLTGIIASLAAQGLSAEEASCLGVMLHGGAADIAAEKLSMQGMLPSDVIAALPLLFKELNRTL